MAPLILHEDRLFPAEPVQRAIARALYGQVKDLPIISPHGHTNPRWFAQDQPFGDPTQLLLSPDHYLFRMLYSQGVPLDALGVCSKAGPSTADPREAWRLLAANMHLFRGTPSAMWLNHVFASVFGFTERLCAQTADDYYDRIDAALKTPVRFATSQGGRRAEDAGVPSPRPVRPLQHRGAGDDGKPHRQP